MTVLAMSHGELSRYETLLRVEHRELCATDEAVLLGLTKRQIIRLLIRLRTDGADSIISQARLAD